jgi:predicted component of type VI protein secretion system
MASTRTASCSARTRQIPQPHTLDQTQRTEPHLHPAEDAEEAHEPELSNDSFRAEIVEELTEPDDNQDATLSTQSTGPCQAQNTKNSSEKGRARSTRGAGGRQTLPTPWYQNALAHRNGPREGPRSLPSSAWSRVALPYCPIARASDGQQRRRIGDRHFEFDLT